MPKSFSNFDEFESWMLDTFGNEKFSPGLERLSLGFKEDLDKIKQQKIKIITIAGTNGKGETAHYLKEILRANNKTFTLWTSPHVLSIRERFESDNGMIALEDLNGFVQSLEEHEGKLSYFEFLLGIFLKWSLSCKPEYLILEVGLGGRLDGVNVFDADHVLLSSIARDHQEYLGKRLSQILKEKYGVVRENTKLTSYLELDYLNDLLESWCQRDNVKWTNLKSSRLEPDFSQRNFELASSALNELNIPEFDQLPDRSFSGVLRNTNLTLFGGHNVDGIRNLVQKLCSRCHNFDKTLLVFSNRAPSDMQVMFKILKSSPRMGDIVLASFDHQKAYHAKGLAENLETEYTDDWKKFLQENRDKKILVTGSYYFLGQVIHFMDS